MDKMDESRNTHPAQHDQPGYFQVILLKKI